MQAVLKYPGAKNRLVSWILQYIPQKCVYVEPFAGSLAVLLNKERSHIETVNDLNSNIVNFFRVLRDQPDKLSHLIAYTPYAREEYDLAFQESEDPIEKARRFAVRCWMAFGCGNRYHNGFRSGKGMNSPNPAKAWSLLPETIAEAAHRLHGVQIEHMDGIELIKRYNNTDVFLYLDPPYLPSTRKPYLYADEMDEEQHIALLQVITEHKGMILLSGYDNQLYEKYLSNWHKVSKKSQAENGKIRTETLWMNYEPADTQLALEDFLMF
uniref:DNA adenine methylase n=1 Tax=Lachnoclostridium phocaeense TaxID=1871021 RepID=UPI0026DC49C5|nr:DNA adenine methylase [Lachnoclostridium phocaeense]